MYKVFNLKCLINFSFVKVCTSFQSYESWVFFSIWDLKNKIYNIYLFTSTLCSTTHVCPKLQQQNIFILNSEQVYVLNYVLNYPPPPHLWAFQTQRHVFAAGFSAPWLHLKFNQSCGCADCLCTAVLLRSGEQLWRCTSHWK